VTRDTATRNTDCLRAVEWTPANRTRNTDFQSTPEPGGASRTPRPPLRVRLQAENTRAASPSPGRRPPGRQPPVRAMGMGRTSIHPWCWCWCWCWCRPGPRRATTTADGGPPATGPGTRRPAGGLFAQSPKALICYLAKPKPTTTTTRNGPWTECTGESVGCALWLID
jgi:hypothetical protein